MADVTSLRETLPCTVVEAARALGGMGRVMVAVSGGGATHERLGPVADVVVEGGIVRIPGEAHDTRIDLAVVSGVVADRSSRMKDRVLPRLEFLDAAGETLFSVIGLDGTERFDAALAPLGAGTPVALKERARLITGQEAPLDAADPGAAPLEAARQAGEAIVITLHRPGVTQSWTGPIEEVKPSMGFINVMRPDFHLHLKGGAVARWRRAEGAGAVALHAEDLEGRATGLILSGSAGAFAAAAA